MLTCRWQQLAEGKRVAGVTLGTSACGNVVNHRAQGIGAARARAGVHALHVDAGLIARALRVYSALGSAIRRLTHVILQTGTRG